MDITKVDYYYPKKEIDKWEETKGETKLSEKALNSDMAFLRRDGDWIHTSKDSKISLKEAKRIYDYSYQISKEIRFGEHRIVRKIEALKAKEGTIIRYTCHCFPLENIHKIISSAYGGD